MRGLMGFTAATVVMWFGCGGASAIDIVFDYSHDTGNFFDTQAKKNALDAAAEPFELYMDSLDAIVPGTVYNEGTPEEFTDTWDANFFDPSTGGPATETDLTIAQDTVLMYVGGRDLNNLTLGAAAPGTYSTFGIEDFVNAAAFRGQPNQMSPGATDFARWGGSIAFDTTKPNSTPRAWHFGLDASFGSGEIDFLSVAMHEIAHVLGFGSADSFDELVNTTTNVFTGAKATEVYGGDVPIDPMSLSHWDQSVESWADSMTQPAIMVPGLPSETRRGVTVLDHAAMMDIGWEVPDSLFVIPVPGDADGDGDVDLDDYNIMSGNMYTATGNGADDGDFNYDGFVDFEDFVIQALNFGDWPSADETISTVPEPASLVLMVLAGVALMRRR